MVKSLCHLLMKVNYVKVANFCLANMSFNAIAKIKILTKISEFTVRRVINSLVFCIFCMIGGVMLILLGS